MCLHGVYNWVNVINRQNNKRVKVDACIAAEIQFLNENGVITLGCCCGHGKTGEDVEWEDAFGQWKGHSQPPHSLIKQDSVYFARTLGYKPFRYYYADGKHHSVWQINLKMGCLTMEDVREWHEQNKVLFKEGIGVVAGS